MTWYTGNAIYDTVLAIGFALTALVVVAQAFTQSPYGRFASNKMGINLNPKLGWWLMELPATVVFLWFFVQAPRAGHLVPTLLAAVWLIHYSNRGWFFPLAMRVAKARKSTFSISVVIMGWLVTAMHGYLNATFFGEYGSHLTDAWLHDARFWAGLAVYYSGFALTLHAESVVRRLRPKPGHTPASGHHGSDYKIPHGGGFRWVSSPAYLGELVGWAGFALMTWSLAGVFIFAISAANLVPRAFATHRWYRQTFADYPRERKALIPYVA